MFFLPLFGFELLLLFFLSRFLTRAFSRIIFMLTKSESMTMWILALLFFPGTLLHELAHFFTAIMLFVRVGHIELFPQKHGESIKMGSVAIAQTDPFRRAIIGLAPLFFGTAGIFGAGYYFSTLPLVPWYINIVFLLLIIFEIGNTMFSSPKDVEGIPALVMVLGLFILAGYIIGIRIPENVVTYINSIHVQTFFQQLSFYMLAPLGINAVVLLLAKKLSP